MFPIDWRVSALAMAVSIVMDLVFGVAPAVLASKRGDMIGVLRRASGTGTRRGRRLRNSLTAMQLAISLALLVGALLLLATMRNLRRVDARFDPSQVAGLSMDLSSHGARALSTRRCSSAQAISRVWKPSA
jgi:hypothetical protein